MSMESFSIRLEARDPSRDCFRSYRIEAGTEPANKGDYLRLDARSTRLHAVTHTAFAVKTPATRLNGVKAGKFDIRLRFRGSDSNGEENNELGLRAQFHCVLPSRNPSPMG
jgi:hypothetical protein